MLWNLNNKAPSNIASPLLVDGRVFVVKKGGISSCFDAKDGKEIWYQKRIRNFGNYYASPIAGACAGWQTGCGHRLRWLASRRSSRGSSIPALAS